MSALENLKPTKFKRSMIKHHDANEEKFKRVRKTKYALWSQIKVGDSFPEPFWMNNKDTIILSWCFQKNLK